MGHLVHELGLVVDRILFISPNSKRLRKQMQYIAEDLVSDFGAGQTLNLSHAKFKNADSLSALLAFDLGDRAGLKSRVQIMGCSLEDSLPSRELLIAADAVVFDWNPGQEIDEVLLKNGILRHIKETPVLALIPSKKPPQESPEQLLRARGQYLHLENSCSKLSICRGNEEFLRLGLEWVLSF